MMVNLEGTTAIASLKEGEQYTCLYLPRSIGRRSLRSVEQEYKLTKVIAYENLDSMMEIACMFDEEASERGHQSFAKDAVTFARELDLV